MIGNDDEQLMILNKQVIRTTNFSEIQSTFYTENKATYCRTHKILVMKHLVKSENRPRSLRT